MLRLLLSRKRGRNGRRETSHCCPDRVLSASATTLVSSLRPPMPVSEYEFAHLEGASSYSLGFDDTASAHSSAISQAGTPSSSSHHHHHQATSSSSSDRDEDASDISKLQLTFDGLSLAAFDGAVDPSQQGVANLYEEDFDGMLDDLNRELPPHACRSVPLSVHSQRAMLTRLRPATVGSTIRLASSSASSARNGSATLEDRRRARILSTISFGPSIRRSRSTPRVRWARPPPNAIHAARRTSSSSDSFPPRAIP
jgi:hypothetical protein